MQASRTNEILGALARDHLGLIHRDQVIHQGISRSALIRRVGSGLLEQVGPSVYRWSGAPETWDQKALLACWNAGPTALLSHRASTLRWGLDGVTSAPFEVLTDRWARRPSPPARVHEANDIIHADRSSIGPIPVTSPLRTVLDLAGVAARYRVEQAMEDALRRRMFTTQQLGDRFMTYARRGKRGIGTLRPLVSERVGTTIPTGSEFELRAERLAVRAGLPAPHRQFPVQLPMTRVYLDLAWPERRFAIECDGVFDHGTAIQLRWDDDRQNEVQLLGWLILRFTWHKVTRDPDSVIELVRRAWVDRANVAPA